MRRVAVIVLLSIAVVSAQDKVQDKDKNHFSAAPASSYPGHQTADNITIAAVPYVTTEQARSAFGKVNPYQHGVLPVLLVLENGTGKAIRLDLRAELVDPGDKHVDATPASDVIYVDSSPKAPRMPGTSPYPNPFPGKVKKGPLNTWEIEGRA